MYMHFKFHYNFTICYLAYKVWHPKKFYVRMFCVWNTVCIDEIIIWQTSNVNCQKAMLSVCIIDQVWLGIVNEGQEAIKTHR